METTVKLLNAEGLHARPAGVLVKTASQYASKIDIQFNGKSANAKSLLSLMSLGITRDAEFIIKAEGQDADSALRALEKLIENKFQLEA